MALFSKRSARTSRRALRKAHTKQLKAQAAAEKKFRARQSRTSLKETAKAEARSARDAAKQAGRKTSTKVAEAGKQATEGARELSAKEIGKAAKARRKAQKASVRNYLGLAAVIGPAAAPIAYRVASEVRGRLDAARARKLGVAVEQLGEFTGHGAALSARIAGIEDALGELVAERPGEQGYRDGIVDRLAELSTAVHAAERMPTTRRKAAHHAIGADLDRVDAELLAHLGVRG